MQALTRVKKRVPQRVVALKFRVRIVPVRVVQVRVVVPVRVMPVQDNRK